MIGSHNKPPPPAKDGDRVSIAAVIGEPEIPLDVANGERGAEGATEAVSIRGYNSASSIRGSNSEGGNDGYT